MVLLIAPLLAIIILAFLIDKFYPITTKPNTAGKAFKKSALIWFVSAAVGSTILFFLITYFVKHQFESFFWIVLLAISIIYTIPVLLPIFLLQFYIAFSIHKPMQRTVILLAGCYLLIFILTFVVFYMLSGNHSVKTLVLAVASYAAANTLAILFSERHWK